MAYYCHLPQWFVFRPALSWPNTGVSIAENAGICVRTAAIFVLIPETFDRIDATCGQMLASVNEIFLSLDTTDTKELHEQNCALTVGTSGATRVISDRIVAIWDLIGMIVVRMCATSIVIGIGHVTISQAQQAGLAGRNK